MKRIRWYVVANRTRARFYQSSTVSSFRLIKEILNPHGRVKERSLDSDRPGIGFSSASRGDIHHAFGRRNTRHEETARRFSKKIALFLKSALNALKMLLKQSSYKPTPCLEFV